MATTAEKFDLMLGHLGELNPEDLSGQARMIAEGLQMARGLGFDLMQLVIPEDPTDLDQFVDDSLRFLYALRGDDLPPFDPGSYGEVNAFVGDGADA